MTEKRKGSLFGFLGNRVSPESGADALVPAADQRAIPAEPAWKRRARREGYKNVTVPRSVHRMLKLASAHTGKEIREIVTEAVLEHPLIAPWLKQQEP